MILRAIVRSYIIEIFNIAFMAKVRLTFMLSLISKTLGRVLSVLSFHLATDVRQLHRHMRQPAAGLLTFVVSRNHELKSLSSRSLNPT